MVKNSIIISVIMILLLSTVLNAAEPLSASVSHEQLGIRWKCVLGVFEVGLAWAGIAAATAGTVGVAGAAIAIVSWHAGNISGWFHIANGCF